MSVVLSKNLWTFIGHFLKPYKRVTLLFVCFAMLTRLLIPLTSVLVKKMIDILETAQTDAVLMAILWPAILFVANFQLQDLCWRGMGCLNYKFQPIIKNQMLKEIFAALHQHKHQFFQQNLAGRISSQINTLADNVERILHDLSKHLIRGAMLLLTAFISMYFINPKFFYALGLWFLCFIVFSMKLSKKFIKLADEHATAEAILSGQ